MKDRIREIVMAEGADVCGFSDVERFADAPESFSPRDIWANCRSVVAFGIALPKGLIDVSPRIVYGHYNEVIKNKADLICAMSAKRIEKEFGGRAVPIPSDTPYDFWDESTLTGKGIISMKHTAVLCGLGTIGKSSLLLNPGYGNMLTLGAFLTDLELESDPLSEDICIPGCSKCIDACPPHAISDRSVNQTLCRPNTYSKTKRGFGTTECNRCRAVCPVRFGKIREDTL
jgi:epoxyqueuosine reductase QueG